MKINFGEITLDVFLKEYWQKKPLLIKNGFKDFVDPISSDELAGLACEDFIESRLITHFNDKWNASFGPFEDYSELGDENWTLVVQSVNHYVDILQDFYKSFHFIPQWRFDDVMISYACKGGSVGPHIDHYDVFICQGSGSRHWKVGDLGVYKEIIPHEKLKHIEPFTPILDVIVEAGDILYIPPGYPHDGVSIGESMSFSIGYKTSSDVDLISGFADFCIDNIKPTYLHDPERTLDEFGKLGMLDQKRVKELMSNCLQSPKFNDFLGRFYTEPMHELDLIEAEYSESDFLAEFKKVPLKRCNGIKVLYIENDNKKRFFINGEIVDADLTENVIKYICNNELINSKELENELSNLKFVQILTSLVNRGFWYFDA